MGLPDMRFLSVTNARSYEGVCEIFAGPGSMILYFAVTGFRFKLLFARRRQGCEQAAFDGVGEKIEARGPGVIAVLVVIQRV